MKKFLSIIVRLVLGVLAAAVLITLLFSFTLSAIPTWGATEAEINRSLPGDDLTSNPTLLWTNAITVNAPPEEVWPWSHRSATTAEAFIPTPSSKTRSAH